MTRKPPIITIQQLVQKGAPKIVVEEFKEDAQPPDFELPITADALRKALVNSRKYVAWCLEHGLVTFDMQDAFIDSNHFDFWLLFAQHVKGADVSLFQDLVIRSGSVRDMSTFANNIKSPNIAPLLDALISKGSVEDWYWLATCRDDYDEADFNRLQQAVLMGGNSEFCYRFAKDIKGADVSALQAAVIDSGKSLWCAHFARDVKGADVARLQEYVLNSTDSDKAGACYLFAKGAKGADIGRLQEVVVASGDGDLCLRFARDVEGADVKRLTEIAGASGVKRIVNIGKMGKHAYQLVDELTSLHRALRSMISHELPEAIEQGYEPESLCAGPLHQWAYVCETHLALKPEFSDYDGLTESETFALVRYIDYLIHQTLSDARFVSEMNFTWSGLWLTEASDTWGEMLTSAAYLNDNLPTVKRMETLASAVSHESRLRRIQSR